MTNDSTHVSRADNARTAWQNQPSTSIRLPTDVMQTRIARIDAQLRRAKFAVIVGGALAFPAFGWLFYVSREPLERIGCVICLVAVTLQVYQLWSHVVGTREMTDTMNTKPSIVAYRAALERQRRFFAGVGPWSRLIAFCAGPLVFLVGAAQASGWDRELGLTAVLCIALPIALFLHSRMRVKRYQTEIDEVDRFQSEES